MEKILPLQGLLSIASINYQHTVEKCSSEIYMESLNQNGQCLDTGCTTSYELQTPNLKQIR